MAEARIDKWMWAVRIFKTRTIAAEACKMNRVTINGAYVKASRMIKPGDVVQVKKPPITYSFKVLQAIEKRVGAKLVPDVMDSLIAHGEPDVQPKKTAEVWRNSQLRNLWMILISTLISTKISK